MSEKKQYELVDLLDFPRKEECIKEAEGGLFMGQPIIEMPREDLLAIIGYLILKRDEEDAKKQTV